MEKVAEKKGQPKRKKEKQQDGFGEEQRDNQQQEKREQRGKAEVMDNTKKIRK